MEEQLTVRELSPEAKLESEMHEIISRGIILDTLNDNGETPLMIAAKRGKIKLVNN